MNVSPNTSRTEPTTGRLDPLAPVVVVGQARSGSTLAAWLMNRSGGLIVNDAYAAQIADEVGGAPARFRAAALARLEVRSVTEGEPPLHRPTLMTPAMRRAAEAARGDDWAALWGAMLHGAAEAGGCAFWGWNTPPDWTRADEIQTAFPRARFVFVSRGVWAVLRSYKALPAHWGRERARWHPALQARAWAAAARGEARLARRAPGRVLRLDYADLAEAPAAAMHRLAGFLGLPAPEGVASPPGRNGSDPGARLSRAEIAVAALALGREGRRLAGPAPAGEGLGLGALVAASGRAAGFYAREAWRSPDMRRRILRMASA